MPLKSEHFDAPAVLSDVLLMELDPRWTRETASIGPCDVDLPLGAVLAKRADNTYVPYLLAESDSAALAVLITPVEAGTAAREGVIARRGCVVAAANLFFIPAAGAADKKKAALAELRERGLVPQE